MDSTYSSPSDWWSSYKPWRNNKIAPEPWQPFIFLILLCGLMSLVTAIGFVDVYKRYGGVELLVPAVFLGGFFLGSLYLGFVVLKIIAKKFPLRNSFVSLEPFPGLIGSTVSGRIVLPSVYPDASIFKAKILQYSRWRSSAGPPSSGGEVKEWEREVPLQVQRSAESCYLNFSAHVPENLPGLSRPDKWGHQIIWKLELRAGLRQADYKIPVIRKD